MGCREKTRLPWTGLGRGWFLGAWHYWVQISLAGPVLSSLTIGCHLLFTTLRDREMALSSPISQTGELRLERLWDLPEVQSR